MSKPNCIKKLKKAIGPDNVLTTWTARHAYASDASPYAIEPTAVALIHNDDHLELARRACAEEGVSIHPRGGGSGLSGGAIGEGIIFDLSRMNRIIKIDTVNKVVDVEAGIVLDHLNKRLDPLGLWFAPDPSSGDTCQVGGMLANNSSGSHSVKYGLTSDYVESLDVLLPDGRRFQLRDVKIGSDEFTKLIGSYEPFAKIYKIIDANQDLIRRDFPRLKKNSAGYNLLAVVDKLDEGIFSLPRLLVGSEGTLGIFIGARLRVIDKPMKRVTMQIFFNDLDDVGEAVVELLPSGPCALELVDSSSMDLIGRDKYSIPETADAMLIMEYDDPPLDEKVEAANGIARKYNLSEPPRAEFDIRKQNELWKARKAIMPTLYRHPGRAKPFGFIEDVEVPGDRVPELVRYSNALFKREGLTAGIYGHIGDGNLHLRPVLDMSTPDGLKTAKRLYREVYEEVAALGGSSTAEHGDGRLRAPVVQRIYGSELYSIFEKIHHELNPASLMNPGVKLGKHEFADYLDFDKLTRLCSSCGKCNNYCPAYGIYSTEEMSSRGWVRIMLTPEFRRQKAKHLLDGCLGCKNCLIVCPSGVDVSEYVTARRSEKQSRIARRVFSIQSEPEKFNKLGKRLRRMMSLIDNKPARFAVDVASRPFVHLDRRRILPKFASKSLPEKYPELVDKKNADVAYFYGCADKLIESNAPHAAIEVLKKAGFSVSLPTQYCCGMPQQMYGSFDYEQEFARRNIDALIDYKHVFVTCATCLGELHSYPKLLRDDPEYREKARELAGKSYDIIEFLFKHADLKFTENEKQIRVVFHQPCHLREVGRVAETHELIRSLPNVMLMRMEDADRCCGAAGTYNVFQYENGMKIFERKKRGFEMSGAEFLLSSCPTCLYQFRDGLKAPDRVKHVVELVNELTC